MHHITATNDFLMHYTKAVTPSLHLIIDLYSYINSYKDYLLKLGCKPQLIYLSILNT
jgi:hypothetical protein